MSFTGNPGTGQDYGGVADREHSPQAWLRAAAAKSSRSPAMSWWGQYIGHTAPKTKEIFEEGDGRPCFSSTRAYYLYRPDNERDYGQEAIEILLQVDGNPSARILGGDPRRLRRPKWTNSFASNPGLSALASPTTSIFRIILAMSCSPSPS